MLVVLVFLASKDGTVSAMSVAPLQILNVTFILGLTNVLNRIKKSLVIIVRESRLFRLKKGYH